MPLIENRAFLLTAPGAAAIAVIRLSGSGVERFLQRHFSRPAVIGRCVHGVLSDGQRIIDDPVVVLVSSTVADVNVHGGLWVVQSALELAKANGFEIVTSLDAVEAPTPLWREVLDYLGQARTELAARMLLAQPSAWANLQKRAAGGLVSVEEIRAIEKDRGLSWMLSLPTVAIIGPANVGKSTLANYLFGQERSITADIPGTTRDWVGEIANIEGLAVMLIDTAGRRAPADPIETAAIAAGLEKVGAADLVLIVLDKSKPIGQTERELMTAYPNAIRIANKADQPAAWEAESINAINTIAISGIGIARLQRAILRHFNCGDETVDRARCWTDRQRAIVSLALKDLTAIARI